LLFVLGLGACGIGAPPGRVLDLDGGGMSYTVELQRFDGTDEFTWSPSAESAYVRFDGTELTHGSVQVTFVNADGERFFQQAVGVGPQPPSRATGQGHGPWAVRLDFTDATGTLAFSAAPAR